MATDLFASGVLVSRSPHGERGLKSVSAAFQPPRGCRSPCLCPVFSAHAGMIPHVRDC